MVRLSIRSNFGVTFTQIHDMRETIVADATPPQQRRAFALAGGQRRDASHRIPIDDSGVASAW
jgi:hypothetical protein